VVYTVLAVEESAMKFQGSQFTATQFDSAEQKAKFANHFVRFVESDFKQTLFPKWFYTRLSMTFGHIAHYNQSHFYRTFFTDTVSKVHFLKQTVQMGGYGSPEFTYSDVEKVLSQWVRENNFVERYIVRANSEHESAERAQLAALKAKYPEVGSAG
jgi:hypothetical protein